MKAKRREHVYSGFLYSAMHVSVSLVSCSLVFAVCIYCTSFIRVCHFAVRHLYSVCDIWFTTKSFEHGDFSWNKTFFVVWSECVISCFAVIEDVICILVLRCVCVFVIIHFVGFILQVASCVASSESLAAQPCLSAVESLSINSCSFLICRLFTDEMSLALPLTSHCHWLHNCTMRHNYWTP